jgi:hypothetical protein
MLGIQHRQRLRLMPFTPLKSSLGGNLTNTNHDCSAYQDWQSLPELRYIPGFVKSRSKIKK